MNFNTLSAEQKAQLSAIREELPTLVVAPKKTREFAISVTSKSALYDAVKEIDSHPELTILTRIGVCKENLRKYGCGLLKISQVIE